MRRIAIFVLAVGVPLAIVAGVVGWLEIPSVVVQNDYFQWSSPPSNVCEGYTITGPSEPANSVLPITVAQGGEFNVSMAYACLPETANGTWTFESAQSQTFGFDIKGSNLPVTFSDEQVAYVNVTMIAPPWHFVGTVIVELVVTPAD